MAERLIGWVALYMLFHSDLLAFSGAPSPTPYAQDYACCTCSVLCELALRFCKHCSHNSHPLSFLSESLCKLTSRGQYTPVTKNGLHFSTGWRHKNDPVPWENIPLLVKPTNCFSYTTRTLKLLSLVVLWGFRLQMSPTKLKKCLLVRV